VVEPFGGDRFLIDGPSISVPPYLGTCCVLLFHELATNATKHGALSVPNGTVHVGWKVQENRVQLNWKERNGPLVAMPERTGFGSRLLKTAFPPEYGEASISFNPDGVDCRISFSLT
jgi:two-component sensor histidine kinase